MSPERVSQCRLTIQYGEFPFDGMGYGEATTNRPVVRLSVACSFLLILDELDMVACHTEIYVGLMGLVHVAIDSAAFRAGSRGRTVKE